MNKGETRPPVGWGLVCFNAVTMRLGQDLSVEQWEIVTVRIGTHPRILLTLFLQVLTLTDM